MSDAARKAVLPAPTWKRRPLEDKGEIMPQYLVANYLPDDFDPSAVTEAMIEEIHALNREMIAAGVRKFACGISPGQQRKDAAGPARRQGARHRRAVHRDQGAHGRFLDTGSCRYGRGTRVGAQGCHLMRCGGRGARASFLPGSGTRTRRKQVNGRHYDLAQSKTWLIENQTPVN